MLSLTTGETGMKNRVLVGYWIFKKIQDRSSRGRVHVTFCEKTLASLAKWSIDKKVWNICVYDNAKSSMATEFFSIFINLQVSNQSILSLILASTTADLIPNPFGSGIEEQTPVLAGRIQIPTPALSLTECILDFRNNNALWDTH